MKLSFALLLTVSFILTGCMEREGSEYDSIPDSLTIDLLSTSPVNNSPADSTGNMIRSYQPGVLPLIPDSPKNIYMPVGMEVSVNAIGNDGGVAVITAGYPTNEGRTMNDSFIAGFGENTPSWLLAADHFSVERKVIDDSHVEYSVRAKENKTGQALVFFVDISDWGTRSDGSRYYSKALIVIEQAE